MTELFQLVNPIFVNILLIFTLHIVKELHVEGPGKWVLLEVSDLDRATFDEVSLHWHQGTMKTERCGNSRGAVSASRLLCRRAGTALERWSALESRSISPGRASRHTNAHLHSRDRFEKSRKLSISWDGDAPPVVPWFPKLAIVLIGKNTSKSKPSLRVTI